MAKMSEAQTGRVKLNISGKIVQTSVTTLTTKSNFFRAMFSGNYKNEKDENGAYFIDRDGSNFDIILNYLRDLILPDDLSKNTLKSLLQEVKFYGLEELEILIKSYLK